VSARRPPPTLEVNVAGLLGEGPGSHRDVDLAGLRIDLGEDLRQGAPIEGRLRIARTNRGLLVTGRLRTSLLAECGRCLAPVEVPIAMEIHEEALPSVDLHSGRPLETTAEPEVVRISDHHELDLETLVREAVQLAAPIAPACVPECPGLCPTCGEERNLRDCGHRDRAIDPRWAALQALQLEKSQPKPRKDKE
jgi:uncharacterized protein